MKLRCAIGHAAGGCGGGSSMWDTFFLSALVGLAFLYVPGYVVLRAFLAKRIVAVACAPLVTVAAYGLLPIAYEMVGIACSWEVLVLPVFGFSVLLFAVLRTAPLVRGTASRADATRSGAHPERERRGDWILLGLYAFVGIVVVGCVFVCTFDDASSFVQEFDNVHHFNTIRAFVDSGVWSSVPNTLYPENVTAFTPPFSGGAFYPSAWHCIVTLLIDALGVPVALGANAVNFLLCAIVLPLGMFSLMSALFSDRRRIVFFGAFTVLAFIAFPWRFLAWGPLLPNLAAFTLLPAVVFCFVSALSFGLGRRARIIFGCLFFAGLVDFAFTQPNAAFSTGVLLIPFCLDRIARFCDSRVADGRLSFGGAKALALVLFVVAVAVVWIALFNAPFVHEVVSYSWPATASVPQALESILTLASADTVAQPALGGLVLIGFAYALAKRKYRWVAASYAIVCFLYVIALSFDGLPKQLLTGFWYTDSMRIAATMVLAAVPLASAGLYVVGSAFARVVGRLRKVATANPAFERGAACAVALLFAAVNFYPGYIQPGQGGPTSAFSESGNFLAVAYSLSGPKLYGSEEIEFVEKVKGAVPEGSLILNEPNDGSAFAYGVNGLNVYQRYVSGWGEPAESEDSKTIRRSLDAVAFDPNVARAVREVGAEYVLQLDQNGKHDGNHYLFSYEENEWFGIDRIDDETPGFEIVLAEGDMRLYRILPTEG